MQAEFTTREQLVEIANKLFVYTDNREWDKLLNEVFAESVLFDMSSLGAGEPSHMPAKQICDTWKKGFEGIDAIHHQAGNYIVSIEKERATVHAYAIASHYKKSATQGNTREFVGSYELQMQLLVNKGWRIDTFRYFVKYATGNVDFK